MEPKAPSFSALCWEGTEETSGLRCVSASANRTRRPALTLPWFLLPPRATWAHSQPFRGLPRALVLRMPGPAVFGYFTVWPLPFCCPLSPAEGDRSATLSRAWHFIESLRRVQLFVTPWPVAHQAPLSPGFSQARLLEWGASPFSRGSSRPRDQPWSPVLQGDSLPSESPGHFIGLSKYNWHLESSLIFSFFLSLLLQLSRLG